MNEISEVINSSVENTSQKMLIGAGVTWLIYLLVRIIPQIITAVTLNKEAKRHNLKNVPWTLAGYGFPLIAPIAFFVYIKISENKLPNYERKGVAKRTVISYVFSSVIVVTAFLLALSSFALGIGGFIRSQVSGEHIISYYDKMGNEYDELDITIDMYDCDKNKYSYKRDGIFAPVVYVDENGNEYDSDKCFIDSEGWFIYDDDGLFVEDESYGSQFACRRFEDKNGNKYFQISDCSFQIDKNGDIWACRDKQLEKLDFEN